MQKRLWGSSYLNKMPTPVFGILVFLASQNLVSFLSSSEVFDCPSVTISPCGTLCFSGCPGVPISTLLHSGSLPLAIINQHVTRTTPKSGYMQLACYNQACLRPASEHLIWVHLSAQPILGDTSVPSFPDKDLNFQSNYHLWSETMKTNYKLPKNV